MKNAITLLVLALTVCGLTGCDGLAAARTNTATVQNAAPSATIPPSERDPNRLWCQPHGVYEDECYICHPELKPDGKATGSTAELDACCAVDLESSVVSDSEGGTADETDAGDSALTIAADACCETEVGDETAQRGAGHSMRTGVLWCNEHDLAEEECGVCQPQLLDRMQPGQGMKVRLASADVLEKVGVSTGAPRVGRASAPQEILGEVSFNQNQLAVVTPLGGGVLDEVLVDVGQRVRTGDLLATVKSPAIAEGKTAYLKAIAEMNLRRETYSRERDLVAKEISARQDLQAAQAALDAARSEVDHARQHLMNLGLTEAEVDAVAKSGTATSTLPIRAPFSGTVVEREAVLGTAVAPGTELFRIADLSTMWMRLSIPEHRLAGVAVGDPVIARFEGLRGLAFEGEVTWVAFQVDAQTRMVQARAMLPNDQGLLKHGMFGSATVGAAVLSEGIAIPREAVQVVDGRPIVFLRLDDDLYETRLVELGAEENGDVMLLAGGLGASDRIVTDGSYILKSEFLKARLGAGCADH